MAGTQPSGLDSGSGHNLDHCLWTFKELLTWKGNFWLLILSDFSAKNGMVHIKVGISHILRTRIKHNQYVSILHQFYSRILVNLFKSLLFFSSHLPNPKFNLARQNNYLHWLIATKYYFVHWRKKTMQVSRKYGRSRKLLLVCIHELMAQIMCVPELEKTDWSTYGAFNWHGNDSCLETLLFLD